MLNRIGLVKIANRRAHIRAMSTTSYLFRGWQLADETVEEIEKVRGKTSENQTELKNVKRSKKIRRPKKPTDFENLEKVLTSSFHKRKQYQMLSDDGIEAEKAAIKRAIQKSNRKKRTSPNISANIANAILQNILTNRLTAKQLDTIQGIYKTLYEAEEHEYQHEVEEVSVFLLETHRFDKNLTSTGQSRFITVSSLREASTQNF